MRNLELPELELLPLDDDVEVADGVTGASPHEAVTSAGRTWGAALGVAGVAVVLGVSALIGRAEVPPRVVPPPEIDGLDVARPVLTTVATPPRGQAGPTFAVVSADHQRVLVSSGRWSTTVDVAPDLGAISSAATGRGFVVVALTNGQARRYSREEPRGTGLGPAELVLTNTRDRGVAWVVWREPRAGAPEQSQFVRAVANREGTPGRPQAVPAGWDVVGSTGAGLVLSRPAPLAGIAVWDPWRRGDPLLVAERGQFLAANTRKVAWRDGNTVVVATARPDERETYSLDGDIRAASFSPDGSRLALIGPMDNTSDPSGWTVRFLADDGEVDEGFHAATGAFPTFGWTSEGDFVVAPGGDVEYRYDPSWGLNVSRRIPQPGGG